LDCVAERLADWAHRFTPTDLELQLAGRSLVDTVAVALAAGNEPLLGCCAPLGEAGRWAVAAHVLDFDDLHVESTSHISAVIVPTVLACGGDARAYLAGAGVMARLGIALGWQHYARGWHSTCTAGAPAAAVAAAVSLGLDLTTTAHAIALAVPAAGGVQQAFGTDAKALQVGFAVDAGVRAAALAANGARADLGVIEEWLTLVDAAHSVVDTTGPAVPGGLAIKLYPCCYAMQRPISLVRESLADIGPSDVERVVVTTPECTILPLIHHRPLTGLQSKFSLEYAIAAAVLDGFPRFGSFTDAAVSRPTAQALLARVDTVATEGGEGLLAGVIDITVQLSDGTTRVASMAEPPGAPQRPPTAEDLAAKIAGCGEDLDVLLEGVKSGEAAALLRARLHGPKTADSKLLTRS
jgi:2-methylcitrate dehydratase PrpD